jgi:predicted ferric reductase
VDKLLLDEHAAWYLSRGSGIVAWVLAAVSIVIGMLFSGRAKRPTPAWTLTIHRHASALTCTFTAVHVAVLMLDPWLKPTVAELLVPYMSRYRPGAVAFGQVAFYLLAVAQISGLLRTKLSRKTFRLIHLSAFPVFAAATIHFFEAGSDTDSVAVTAAIWAVVAVVCAATLARVVTDRTPRRPAKRPVQDGRTLPTGTVPDPGGPPTTHPVDETDLPWQHHSS